MTPVVCVEQNARNATASHRDAHANYINHNAYDHNTYDHNAYDHNIDDYNIYDYNIYDYNTTKLHCYWATVDLLGRGYDTIGTGDTYYTMEQYKAGACNTFHTGAEPASFTSQEQWDYLVGADGKIVVESSLWIGLEFDAAGNLAWINGQPVTWVRAPAALGNTGTPGFAFDDLWEPNDPENPTTGFPDRTIICRAPPPS
ncbi:hypothetical protein WR25_23069 [Diploscapter pachys]|uniref:C-type lectin domain-containing protein n=1 Tax=Diploscapter pachys TaxID=2018661 RepID=A0A2A2KZ86_9BILA|nr:hypothetical protein WR25_23069 [Diploscapter pachys]